MRGQQYQVAKAKELGLIDELVGSVAELVPAAKTWITAHPRISAAVGCQGVQDPWRYPNDAGLAAVLPAIPANLRRELKGAPMPAPRAILAAAVEGTQVDFDTASQIETRYLVKLVTGQIAKNMMKAFYFDWQSVRSGASRPSSPAKFTAHKVGVVGAGMMGAAVGYVSAKAVSTSCSRM